MQTSDGKPTKTNQDILRENEELRTQVNRFITRPEVSMDTAIIAEVLLSINERLGDIWMWAKERR